MTMITDDKFLIDDVLRDALVDNQKLPEFYDALLSHQLITLGMYSGDEHTHENPEQLIATLRSDIVIRVHPQTGERVLPVFTSKAQRAHTLPNYIGCSIVLKTTTLLDVYRDLTWILNPGTSLEHTLSPVDLQQLVQHALDQQQQPSYIFLDISQYYPDQMIKALRHQFRHMPAVSQAYIALVTRGVDKPASYLLGIKTQEDVDFQTAILPVAPLIRDTVLYRSRVDVESLSKEEVDPCIYDYFTHESTPFYDQRWGHNVVSLSSHTQRH